MKIAVVILLWLAAAVAALLALRRLVVAQRSRRRAFRDVVLDQPPAGQGVFVARAGGSRGTPERRGLGRWLYLAGFRRPGAASVFLTATAFAAIIGVLLGWTFFALGPAEYLVRGASHIPGGIGEIATPIAYLAPWFVFMLLALVPYLYVRQARRDRVMQVEQDLPTTLELLATLSEAGLGVDSAVARIRETSLGTRPLASELRTYQADLLSGRSRVESLRRLARRLEVPPVTVFVSALVQAEQLGMGVASVLRRQADDQRDRRRERANAFAMALPVKRIFPLVICFLPGLFVWALGPFFVQLFQLADTFARVRGLR